MLEFKTLGPLDPLMAGSIHAALVTFPHAGPAD